ncbi:MAG: alpha/beta hydrolase-fold protein [Salinimicrobium sp.]
MHRILLFFALSFTFQICHSQAIYKKFNSTKLGSERELKIQLPRNYDSNKEKRYPLIIVLDGDYLFEPMAGNIDYYSYWDEIPESIVVGVNQASSRISDSAYDEKSSLPVKTGAKFFEFIGMELLPFLDNNYRTTKFSMLVGHDLTANFINYYLFKENPLFKAYINLSPDLAPKMEDRLEQSLATAESPKWFYLVTSAGDVPRLKKEIRELDNQLKTVENENLHYFFDDFPEATHYTLVGQALPRALEKIFASYRPISLEDYDIIIASEQSAYEYLREKYEKIQNNYGIEKRVRINDYLAIGKALEDQQQWDELEKLGDLAQKEYPESILGNYYLARSYEENGRTRKAMKTYQSAYGKESVAFMTIDFMLEKAEQIKKDFGY